VKHTWLSIAICILLPAGDLCADDLKIRPGDHICILGNTLADRMQHHGWLETYLQLRFPDEQLVIRNLGFSGDELTTRLRSANFGSPDDHLRIHEADVIFAFFGYNESFAGADGLAAFKQRLADFIQRTLSNSYNNYSPPRLVLFSPIAHEDLHDRNLPDGQENNERLAMYTRAMAEVAEAEKATEKQQDRVFFVDLFTPSQAAYADAPKPLTINGIHLTGDGYRWLAETAEGALFADGRDLVVDDGVLQQVRQAVLDKNFYWFQRYRTTDGYSIFGGRSGLTFVDGQTNRDVMRREMEILDLLTRHGDRTIWARLRGQGAPEGDPWLPPFVPVTTNKPGDGPGGRHLFLSGEEAVQKMQPAEGFSVNLYASEEMFPEMINPVQMAWDTKNRLWVAVWPTYPHWKPTEPMNDKLMILEDTDGDGRADKCKTFADGLHNPTGFEFYNGGVIVAMAPDLLYLKDTDGDDVADVRMRILHGIDSADTHHTANSFVFDPGGALYFQEGTFHHTQVETPYGPPRRSANAGVFRFEPRTGKFDVFVAFGFANPHGHVFDRWGNDIIHDGTGAVPYDGALFSGHVDFPRKHGKPPTVYQQRTRPCSGTEILSSSHFPPENQGNLLVCNVIGFQGILQYRIDEEGASFVGTEVEPIVSSTDPNFRPTDIEMGPDGAIYFSDWQNPIIGHMQHNLRDPSRDREHGRVYRIRCTGRPLLQPQQIDGAPIADLLDLLKSPEDRVRYRARIELGARETEAVIEAASQWLAALDSGDPHYEHHRLEALWLHQSHNVVNEELLRSTLTSPDHRARAAATRVLCYWRDRASNPLELLSQQVADEHPRVRLEAIRACSFMDQPEAAETALLVLEQPMDEYLEYVLEETMKTLEE
jgi:glucose/arabinose dehydrogenase/lysophospholipase L1-like esterase